MRELMDEVHFNERGNQVTLILRLEPEGSDRRSDRKKGGGGAKA
jgi:hypothetical protein